MTCGWKVWGQQPWRAVRVLVQSPHKMCTALASKSFGKRAWNGQRGWTGKLRQGWLWPGCAAQGLLLWPPHSHGLLPHPPSVPLHPGVLPGPEDKGGGHCGDRGDTGKAPGRTGGSCSCWGVCA